MTKIKEDLNFKDKGFNSKRRISFYRIFIFVIFIFFIVVSTFIIRNSFLESSGIAGYEIAKKTYLEATESIKKVKEAVKFTAYNIDLFVKQNHIDSKKKEDKQKLVAYLSDVRKLLDTTIANSGSFNSYVAVGPNITCDIYEPLEDYLDATTRPWYKNAMLNPGTVAISDPYIDLLRNVVVFTLSCATENGVVYAVDFYQKLLLSNNINTSSLGDFSFYLLNENNLILTFYSYQKEKYDVAQSYVNDIISTVKQKKSFSDEKFIVDKNGDKLNYFYYQDPNSNWSCIVTISYVNIFDSFVKIVWILFSIVILFIITEIVVIKRENHLRNEIEITNEALKVVGNSYHFLIRVDCKTGNFKILKATVAVRKLFAPLSNYDEIVSVISSWLKKEDVARFYNSFCLDSIDDLNKKKSIDLGSDFLVKSPDFKDYTWFNVRLLFDVSLDLDDAIIAVKEINDEKLRDIEEHQLLKDSLLIAEQNEKNKTEFFSRISHDMRTPLNGITGLCTLALAKTFDEKTIKGYLNKISDTSKQLLTLVNDLLDISKDDANTNIVKEPFSLTACIDEALAPFFENAKLESKTITSKVKIIHDHVIGDKARLIQVLNNLISNSLKYSNKNASVSVVIREVIEQEEPSFIITIKDTGIGMSEQFLKEIFVPYARENRSSAIGTGLGLSIVKNLVTKMHGSIDVQSKLNEGTTFTINIPFDVIDDNDDAVFIKKENQQVKNVDNSLSIANLTILLVEDNELNMEIASELLELEGAKVIKAWNGKEAVEIFEKSNFDSIDAILMDMRMPLMNGCEAASAIRALNRSDALWVPIIAVTANAFSEDITATKKAGMNAHISKPINFAILKETLSALLQDKQR